MSGNSFEGLEAFVAVAEQQGFSAAARHLGVSTSHISRLIAKLEAKLGVALVARTTRKVRLTQAGELYYQRCRELLHGIEEINAKISSKHLELGGTLRVSAAGGFAERFIAPALIDFANLHPGLNIEMDFNSRMVNFVEEGIDFSIRYGKLTHAGLVARKLLSRHLMAAASPSYLEKRGRPKHPDQLKQHMCLIANSDVWRFEVDGETQWVKVAGNWRSNNSNAIVHACCAGLGIAYMPRSSFGTAVSDGSLEPVLAPYWTRNISTWIVYSNKKYLPLRAKLAIEYLQKRFKNWNE